MPSATQTNFDATSAWADLTATVTAAVSSDVLIQNIDNNSNVQVFFGGASAPASDAAGSYVRPGSSITGNAAKVWVRSATGATVSVITGHQSATGGGVASGAADSGNPVKVAGVYNSTQPTFTTGQRGDLQVGSRGSLAVSLFTPDGTNGATIGSPADGASASANALKVQSVQSLFNGSTFDRAKKPSSVARLLSAAATTNATSVKASAGDLFRIRGYNAKASAVYLKLYNKASAPTVGTDTPIATLYLPASASFDIAFDTPLYFSTGIAYALTGAAADADTTALVAADVVCLNVLYA